MTRGLLIAALVAMAAALLAQPPLEVDGMVLEAAYPDMVTAVANRLAMRFPLGELAAPLLMAQLPMRLGIEPGALSPVDRARGTKVPVLVLSGSLDRRTTPADTRRLFGAFAGEKWLVLFDGARH